MEGSTFGICVSYCLTCNKIVILTVIMQFSVTKQTHSVVVFMAFCCILAIKQTQPDVFRYVHNNNNNNNNNTCPPTLTHSRATHCTHTQTDAPPLTLCPQTTSVRLSCEPMLWQVRNQSLERFLNAINFQTQQLQTH